MRVRTILAFVLLAATSLLAQTFRGTVLGTVTDSSGAVVSGANVVVRNVNTGQERTTQTSADGSYTVPELPIGTYYRHHHAGWLSNLGYQRSGGRCRQRAPCGCGAQGRASLADRGSVGR